MTMRTSLSTFCFAALAFATQVVFAQASSSISVDFDSVKFQNLVAVLEQKAPVKFWYQDSLFANYYVKVHAHEQPLDTVLKQVFDDPIIKYKRYGNNIFVFKEHTLSVELPEGIFKRTLREAKPLPERDVSEYELK